MSGDMDAKVVIVGGGVIGLGVAYHLAKLGIRDVVLIERNQLTSGTSWHAAGIVGPLRASYNQTQLASYATELFPALEAETGQSTGYRRTGGYWLARTPERMTELRRITAMGDITGIAARIMDAEELAGVLPWVRTDDLAGGLRVEDDAQASPVDVCMAYAKAARAGGVRILEGASVAGIETEKTAVRAVTLSDGKSIRCEIVVNCAGAWAREIGALAGVPVPLQAVEHMYVVTEPMAVLPDPVPIMRDLDSRIYIKGDAGKLVLGGFEPHAKTWDVTGCDGATPFLELPEDWDQFEPFMLAGLNRIPALEEAGIQHFMNGPESFTPDSRPLLGESPFLKGFFVAAGMNSTGMMSSAGVGKVMAEWIVDGAPPMDLWAVDIARFGGAHVAKPYLIARMEEAVSDVFDMHWPYKQQTTGRDLKRGSLHDRFNAAGAVFGAPTGWERPLWFAADEAERRFAYSYGDQCWWRAAERESIATRDCVAVYDLSPFGKFDVSGPGALTLLQTLCAADVDVAEGRAVYGQMLNEKGGIEADVTVTRTGETAFRVTSGAATRWKDMAWLTRHCDALGLDLAVSDETEDEAVLAVMGPLSRELLQSLGDADLSAEAFPFATSAVISIAGVELRATRVSFVGELGWELYIPAGEAARVYDAVVDAGAAHGLAHAGHLTLDCCRMEKGFRHWSHDIGPEDTPLESGLAFAVDWDKPDFIGRDALLRKRDAGVAQRLMQFVIDAGRPLVLHDEPIFRNGEMVGRTTSGGQGFRTGLTHAMGYVACQRGQAAQALECAGYEIEIAGERYPARAAARAPYDPDGSRMKG